MKNFFKRSRAVKRLLGKRPRYSKFSFERYPTRSIEPLEMRVVLSGDPLTSDSAWYDSSSIDLSVRCMLASSAGDSSGVSALNAGGGGGGGDVNPLVEDPTVTFRLEAQNLSDAPISTITAGQDFQVAVFVQDTRDPASSEAGVFAAYLNVFYSSALASVNTSQSIEYGPGFSLTQTGTLSTAGQIVAAGAARGSLDAPGNAEQLLFRVTVHADAAGILHLTSTFDSSPGHQTLVFLDDDPVPQTEIEFGTLDLPILSTEQQSLSTSDATVTEGTSAQNDTPAVFTVSLSLPYVNEVTVAYSAVPGTASDTSDFLPTSGTLVFAPGETQKLVTVMVDADAIDEIDEQFTLVLANPTSATISDGTGSGTIGDDDAPPTISVADALAGEGSTMSFSVTLSGPSGKEITFVASTANGTASENDYGANTGTTFTFAPGATSQVVTVSVASDTIDEFDETFTLNLSAPVNVTLGDASGTGTITDDDEPPTVSISNATSNEGDGGTTAFLFTVTLSGQSGKPITVQYATADDTATDPDYLSTSGTLAFAAGETEKVITVLVNGDTMDEPDSEMFLVNLSNATNATLDDASGIGTINDDDAPPEVSVSNIVSHLEGDAGTTPYVFTISLSSASGKVVTVQYGTNDLGDSTQDTDYVGTTGTLVFAAGETEKEVTVLVNGDAAIEDNETFRLVLLEATNASVNTEPPGGLGTIINDDGPHISFVFNQVSQNEGDSGTKAYVYTVTIGEVDNENPVTVAYTTVDDTATSGSGDYVATSGTLTFEPGQLTQTITVLVNGDDDDEADETFKLVLSNASSNATFVETTATGVLQNDDDVLISFNPQNVSQAEGNTNNQMLFTVTLSHATQQTVSVQYDTLAGSATAGTDYQSTSGTLVFQPGITSQVITVTVIGDLSDEVNEGFSVRLFNSVNAENASSIETAVTTSGTIEDDDPVPTLTIAPISLPEANLATTAYVFTATLSQASGKTIEVAFQTSDGTATTANSDYAQRSGTLTFLPGETQRVFTVFTISDMVFEPSETFNLNLTALDSNVTLANATIVNTIENDDPLPTISIANAQTIEGNSSTQNLTIAVTLSNASSTPVVVSYATASGTAISGVDFNSKSETITFAPGETQRLITVSVIGDVFNELNETFTVTLSNLTGATMGNAVSTVTLLDNDALPAVTITNVSAAEGDSGLTPFVFTVTMNPASGQVVTVEYAVSSGTATIGSDFQATSGTLTFQPGETSKFITVNIIGDQLKEADETFTVNLFNPTNATTFNFDGLGTIQNGADTLVISPSTLSGFAFVDSDGDNKIDLGEIPLAGTLVTLTGTKTAGGAVNMSTAANVAGFYSFTGLDPGTYSVSFDVTAGKFSNAAVTVGDQGGTILSGLSYRSTVAASVAGQNNNLTVKSLMPAFISQRFYLSSFDSTDGAKEFASSTPPASQNTFVQTGNVLNIRGTAGNDNFEFKAGTTLTVTLNGETKTYDPASVSLIYFDGLGGDDSANLVGSIGADIATQGLGFASLAGSNYTIHANNVSRIRVDGGAGADTATLQDSAISDTLLTTGAQARLENVLDQLALALAFEQVTARSSAGGTDTATSNQINYTFSKVGNWTTP